MNAAVADQPFQGALGHFAAQGVVGGQDDGLGSVVDDQVDTRGGFYGPDVTSFAADDAPLHVFARQFDGTDRMLGHIVAGVTLHGAGDDHLRLAVGRLLRFNLDHAHHLGCLVTGLALDLLHEPGAGLFGRQPGYFLQTGLLQGDHLLQTLLLLLDGTFLLGDLLLQVDELAFLLGQGFDLLFQALFLGLQPGFVLFQFPFAVLGVLLDFLFQSENFILGLKQNLLFVRLRVFLGFIEDALGQSPGIFDLFVGDVFLEQKPRDRTDTYTDKGGDDDLACHDNSLARYI